MGITEKSEQADVAALQFVVPRELRAIVEGDGPPGGLGQDGEYGNPQARCGFRLRCRRFVAVYLSGEVRGHGSAPI